MSVKEQSQILEIVEPAIQQLPDSSLRQALLESYIRESASLAKVEDCFQILMARKWSPEVLVRFFHGWGDLRQTAASVSGLVCRLLRLASEEKDTEKQRLYFLAGAATSGINYEDFGLDGGTLHAELFYRFITAVCGDDRWQSRQYRFPESYELREWVYHQRLMEDIQDGLMTTVITELYNHGEFNMIAPILPGWLEETLGISSDRAAHDFQYIFAHAEEVESGHFNHGIVALQYYCKATERPLDYEKDRKSVV